MKPEILRVPRLELCVEREGGKATRRVMVLDSDFVRVGAHPSNDLVLSDRLVSRFHCILERSGQGFRVTDVGSLNGIWIGGARVRDADIQPECVIELGESTIRVRDASAISETELPAVLSFGSLWGASLSMRRMFHVLQRVAQASSDVLIEGENGTGKELIATELVQRSNRAQKPLVIVDCGAISPTLIESELFGHVRGSFTGASRDRAGAFEEADGGTVFLDEIGELPLEMQPKLLRALASREVRRVGESRARKVDIRVIAATNRRLEREVNSGRFREDLYYRLSVVTVRVPPLRERKEDIPLLVQHFLGALGASDRSELFPPDVMDKMLRYDWPGNVRELRNQVERTVVLGGEALLEGTHSDGQSSAPLEVGEPGALDAMSVDIERPFKEAKEAVVDRFEREYLVALLGWASGNVSRAARKAGLDRMYLHRLLQRHGLRRGAALD
ncbi:sigma 54-interacting transcriptional regulator [Chondromyces apiculatus]|uniref:Response regulator of zinc sigma-54-dependent two-component system n=1 Tax=Chondromyces apiculatus DSM 436 TaxID=1192034 RepID=A0A017TC88_9BACT|nr:sigma 54-interacting transcriptional regulator [Chondromyces apiculatus]EYF06512.1 Response regulator of zinc sigma-54-dependent two-component system [Chondromyces apiculatus DSM 436]